MNQRMDIESVRAEALRKLGRNIMNISKIEAAFKYLLPVSQLEGCEKTISEQFSERQASFSKQTLGRLVKEFNKNVLYDAAQPEPTADLAGTGISFSIRITCDNPDFLEVQRCKLSSIVTERNNLIHHDLALIDTSSMEDCHKLISLLDEQNPRLLAQIEELRSIIDSVREIGKALEELAKSPNFPQCFPG